MSSRTLISVEEYLASTFRLDCDYVDGHIEERNLGERTHGRIQGRLIKYLGRFEEPGKIEVLPEVRVQVRAQRFRVPDVCVVLGDSDEEILTEPPFLCVEILSPEDRMTRVKERINDYFQMGVPYAWVLDPQTKKAFRATPKDGWQEVTDGVLRTEDPVLEVPLSEIFR
jgi:Uma2 family endonuclease